MNQQEPDKECPQLAVVVQSRSRTEAQKAASRANGARSLGPCTPEGKERSRQNARKHDLTSALFTPAYLSSPDHAEYTAMLHDLIDEFDPRTRSAMSAVEVAANALINLRRVREAQAYLMTDSAPEAGLFLPPPPLKQGGIVDHEKETARLEAESATVAAGGDQEVEVAAAVVDCLRSGRPLELSEEERAIALRLLHYTLDLLRRSEKEADSATPGTTLSPDAVIYRRIAPEGLPLTNPEHLPKVLTTPNRIPKNRREAWVLLSERALQLSRAARTGISDPRHRARTVRRFTANLDSLLLLQDYEERLWRQSNRALATLQKSEARSLRQRDSGISPVLKKFLDMPPAPFDPQSDAELEALMGETNKAAKGERQDARTVSDTQQAKAID